MLPLSCCLLSCSRVPRRLVVAESTVNGMTTELTHTRYRFVMMITALSVAHHVDHILRGVTGWPLGGGFNPFSASLFVYPVIAIGVNLSKKGRAGDKFWSLLAGGGALFILAVHVGPAAGDAVSAIPDGYDSAVADVVALATLAVFFLLLVAHCIYEISGPRSPGRRSALVT